MSNYCSNCGENLYGQGDPPAHACPPGDQKEIAKHRAMLARPWLQKGYFDTGSDYDKLAKRTNQLESLIGDIEMMIRRNAVYQKAV